MHMMYDRQTKGRSASRGAAQATGRTLNRIAVVEDNIDNRLLVSLLLHDRYDVEQYETGWDALQAFEQGLPALLLLDVSLPQIDALDMLRRIRREPKWRHLPVIALTSHTDRERMLAAGFDEHVTKPILDASLLFDAIQKCLPT
jgi:CheY-like chemotaxis protein